MPKRVCDVKGVAVSAQRQVTRIGPLKLRKAGGDLSNLVERRPRIDAKCAHLVFRSVCNVKTCARGIEQGFLAVEAGFEMTDDGVRSRIDYGAEVSVLIKYNYIRTWINRRIQR